MTCDTPILDILHHTHTLSLQASFHVLILSSFLSLFCFLNPHRIFSLVLIPLLYTLHARRRAPAFSRSDRPYKIVCIDYAEVLLNITDVLQWAALFKAPGGVNFHAALERWGQAAINRDRRYSDKRWIVKTATIMQTSPRLFSQKGNVLNTPLPPNVVNKPCCVMFACLDLPPIIPHHQDSGLWI